jgi:hypothetical protein
LYFRLSLQQINNKKSLFIKYLSSKKNSHSYISLSSKCRFRTLS